MVYFFWLMLVSPFKITTVENEKYSYFMDNNMIIFYITF